MTTVETVTALDMMYSKESTVVQCQDLSLLADFSQKYRPIHGWLVIVVGSLGLITNLLTIVVFTRANLRRSPTSLILVSIAASDFVVMLSTLIFVSYFYIAHDSPGNNRELSPNRDTWAWTHFSNAHVLVTFTAHCISIWLNVYLACFRYIYIVSSSWSSHYQVAKSNNILRQHENKPLLKSASPNSKFKSVLLRVRTYNFTLAAVVSICAFCICLSIPAYIYPTVRQVSYSNNSQWDPASKSNTTRIIYVYKVEQSDLDKNTDGLIFKITFYLWAIVGKLIPCALLFVFSALLVRSLVQIGRKSNNLKTMKIGSKPDELRTSCISAIRKSMEKEKISTENNSEEHRRNSEPIYSKNKTIAVQFHENNLLVVKPVDTTVNHRRNVSVVEIYSNGRAGTRNPKRPSENIRTTLMLIIVCSLFLFNELIHSVLILMSIIDRQVYFNVYLPLGDILDMMTFVTSSIDFVIYCSMSSTFRKTFYSLFVAPKNQNHSPRNW